MAASTPDSDVEWVGGLLKVPAYIIDDGQPFRPEVLFWLDQDGVVLSSRVAKPGTLLQTAAQSLRHTIGGPLFGRQHAPTTIRVASPELASVLRAGCPELETRCAPTPELDALAGLLHEKLAQQPLHEQSYLAGGVEVSAMEALFDATADLYDAAPWQTITSDQHLLSITSEELGLKHAVLSIVGQLGKNRGLVLFGSYADFQRYLSAGDALARGELAGMPAHFTLSFERGSELSPTLRKQILSHGWRVAGTDAYPWMLVLDEDLVARLPTTAEVTVAEVIARALPQLLLLDRAKPELAAAWSGGKPVSRTLRIATRAGRRHSITLVASDKLDQQLHWVVDDVLAKLAALRLLAAGGTTSVLTE